MGYPMAYPGFPAGGYPGFPGYPPMMAAVAPTDPAAAWQEYAAPDGRKYYHNALTQETTWEKPQAVKDREAGGSASTPNAATASPGGATSSPGAQLSPAMAYAAFQTRPMGGMPMGMGAMGGATPLNKNDKSRPVSSNAVAGTPWCVVWTGDSKVRERADAFAWNFTV